MGHGAWGGREEEGQDGGGRGDGGGGGSRVGEGGEGDERRDERAAGRATVTGHVAACYR